MSSTAINPEDTQKARRYETTFLGIIDRLGRTEKMTPRPPASNAAMATPIVETMRSARNPVTRVLSSRVGAGVSTERACGSRKRRSVCWRTRNRIHQKTTVDGNDQLKIL